MIWRKVTWGFVIQTYKNDVCVEQEFFAGDQVDYEDDKYGDPIDPPVNEQHYPLDMIQPPPCDTTL